MSKNLVEKIINGKFVQKIILDTPITMKGVKKMSKNEKLKSLLSDLVDSYETNKSMEDAKENELTNLSNLPKKLRDKFVERQINDSRYYSGFYGGSASATRIAVLGIIEAFRSELDEDDINEFEERL